MQYRCSWQCGKLWFEATNCSTRRQTATTLTFSRMKAWSWFKRHCHMLRARWSRFAAKASVSKTIELAGGSSSCGTIRVPIL